MIRPTETSTASFAKYTTRLKPPIGECCDGVGDGEKPNDDVIAMARSSWNGSVTSSTVTTRSVLSWGATDATLLHVSAPLPRTIALAGTPLASSHVAEIRASV